MIRKEISISVLQYDSVGEFAEQEQILIQKAFDILNNAYAPYSNFNVGVSLLLNDGTIVTGTNQENAAYPSGLCAERVALFYANSTYPNTSVKTMVICAKNKNGIVEQPISPCGACRQVILESEMRYNQPIKIILAGTNSILVIENSKQLLPLHFEKDVLQK